MKHRLFPVVILAVVAPICATTAARAIPLPSGEARLCTDEVGKNERLHGIPSGLLNAISVAEAGRYDSASRSTVVWPWTVTAEGQGRYLPSKAEAIAEVRRLKARGVTNIDVGCMQINLRYHPNAFTDLEQAFDPDANVAYAARFLKGLYGATDGWMTAASYYHSQTPSLAAAYRGRIAKIWNGPDTGVRLASSSPPGAGLRYAWRQRQAVYRAEARQIAEAWRQARLAEYRLRVR